MSAEGSAASAPVETAVFELLAKALATDGNARIWVSGTSMTPLLRPGDEIEIVPRLASQLSPGDIGVFASEAGALVIHRFLRHASDGLLCRGDSAPATDPGWPEESLLGVAIARSRAGHRLPLDRGLPRLGARARALAAELRRILSRVVRR